MGVCSMRIDRSIRVTRMRLHGVHVYAEKCEKWRSRETEGERERERESEENRCQKKSIELHLHANPRFPRFFVAGWCAASNDTACPATLMSIGMSGIRVRISLQSEFIKTKRVSSRTKWNITSSVPMKECKPRVSDIAHEVKLKINDRF